MFGKAIVAFKKECAVHLPSEGKRAAGEGKVLAY